MVTLCHLSVPSLVETLRLSLKSSQTILAILNSNKEDKTTSRTTNTLKAIRVYKLIALPSSNVQCMVRPLTMKTTKRQWLSWLLKPTLMPKVASCTSNSWLKSLRVKLKKITSRNNKQLLDVWSMDLMETNPFNFQLSISLQFHHQLLLITHLMTQEPFSNFMKTSNLWKCLHLISWILILSKIQTKIWTGHPKFRRKKVPLILRKSNSQFSLKNLKNMKN